MSIAAYRRAIAINAVALATAALGVAARGPSHQLPPQAPPADAAAALQVLGAARGVSPLACELIVAMLSSGRRGGFERNPDAPGNFLPQVHWIMQRSTDAARVAPLRRGLKDPDPCVRRIAPRLLARSDHPQAITALLETLRDPSPAARRSAAVGLGYASHRETINALQVAIGDEDPDVRHAAAWALARLRGTSPVLPAPTHPAPPAVLAWSEDGAAGSPPLAWRAVGGRTGGR